MNDSRYLVYHFTAMNEEQQAEILWERGLYLMVRQEREHKFALYQLDAFMWKHYGHCRSASIWHS